MLPLKLVDRLKPKALAPLMRHEIESVAGDDKCFAPFHLAGELGQPVLCVPDGYGPSRKRSYKQPQGPCPAMWRRVARPKTAKIELSTTQHSAGHGIEFL